MHHIIISRAAEKQLTTFPKDIANNIATKIDLLSADPRPVVAGNWQEAAMNNGYGQATKESFIGLKMRSLLSKSYK